MTQPDTEIFAHLDGQARIWAIGAIHGENEKLSLLFQRIAENLEENDRVLFLGNYSGVGPNSLKTINQILLFRRWLLARPGGALEDVVFLRGAQEEMWRKLMQLQLAPNPSEVLQWMLKQGIGATISSYGERPEDAMAASREGVLAMTRWTSRMGQKIRSLDGHGALMSNLRHAALTTDKTLLFVHTGLDLARSLHEQGDRFWWGSPHFEDINSPFDGFTRVIRGFDRKQGGFTETPHLVTLDGGAGFGGEIIAACFHPDGTLLQTLSSGTK